MTTFCRCAFCERAGTTRELERIPVCASHRAALRWKTIAPARNEPRERVPADYLLELMGRAALLAG